MNFNQGLVANSEINNKMINEGTFMLLNLVKLHYQNKTPTMTTLFSTAFSKIKII